MLRVRAITPRRLPMATNTEDLARRALGQLGFAGDMVRDMADYPTQQPTTYRRTGTLGREWTFSGPARTPTGIGVLVYNPVGYAVYVEGPRNGPRGRRQTAVMRGKGWPSISDVAERLAKKHGVTLSRVYSQKDRSLRFERL